MYLNAKCPEKYMNLQRQKQLGSLACYVIRNSMGYVGTTVLLGQGVHTEFLKEKFFLSGQKEVTEHGKITL
jgi:hypothetical protein